MPLRRRNHLYVTGDYAVGKTSFIKRYCEGYFTPNYKLTIGVDFAVKGLLSLLLATCLARVFTSWFAHVVW